jgi:hypothetical protein
MTCLLYHVEVKNQMKFFSLVLDEVTRIKKLDDRMLAHKLKISFNGYRRSKAMMFKDRTIFFQTYLAYILDLPANFFEKIREYEDMEEIWTELLKNY